MNNFKRIFAVIMILSVVLCLAACVSDPGTTTGSKKPDPSSTASTPSSSTGDPQYSYRIKVVDENGKPVAGVSVQLCDDANCYPKKTDAEGYATYMPNIAPVKDGWKTVVTTAEGYTFSEEYTYLEPGQTEVTLVITAIPDYSYRIRVVDENGNPVEGASVQLCDDANCFPKKTDADGYAYYKAAIAPVKDGWKTVVTAANGYTYSEEYTYLEPGQTEVTLVVTSISEEAPENGAEG